MGAVYEAEEIELARKVAIKVIHDFNRHLAERALTTVGPLACSGRC